jgi:hypothetical protein
MHPLFGNITVLWSNTIHIIITHKKKDASINFLKGPTNIYIYLGNENVAQKDIDSQKLKQVRAVIIISQTSTEIATVE